MIPNHIWQKFNSENQSNEPFIIARAPGRINLIGEHTDYNRGLVLPASIDQYLYIAIQKNESKQFNAHAIDLGESCSIDIHQLKRTGTLWFDYLVGLLSEYQKLGIDLIGIDCAITSEIPVGAGVSSSAALECAFMVGVNELLMTSLDRMSMVELSNRSNHNFLGIKSGILDQFASLFGRVNHGMLLDCDTKEYRYIEIPESEFTWLLINSNVTHSHLTSGYNKRVEECQSALKSIQKNNPKIEHLSQISSTDMLSDVDFESPVHRNRAEYVVEENQRVRAFIKRLNTVDFRACGQILYESHLGLSSKYEVSCAELDFLVDILRPLECVLGSRMMGGGFGGCTLNLVQKDSLTEIQEIATTNYLSQFSIEPSFITVKIGRGAELIKT